MTIHAARKFSDLRRVQAKDLPVPDHKDEAIETVIRRLFMTGTDGPRVLAWMEQEVGRPLAEEPTDRALSLAEGARRFVHSLKSTVVHVAPRSTPD